MNSFNHVSSTVDAVNVDMLILWKWQSTTITEYANTQHVEAKQIFSMPKINYLSHSIGHVDV